MTEPLLRIEGLTRRFGGLTAVRQVSLSITDREIHAIIGPNGAGKSTLVNMLSGDLKPSEGSIRLGSHEIAGWSADRVSQLGIGRSYQRTNIFPGFSVLENCRLAAQSRLKSSFRFFRPALSYPAPIEAAASALELTGLSNRRDAPAAILSHGEQRQLEIAMSLATSPRLLLLDEPLAGMGAEEAAGMVSLLRRLASDRAIILVEHDMDAVFSLADRITVMVNGSVLESGIPEAVRASRAVQEAYLGTDEAELSDEL